MRKQLPVTAVLLSAALFSCGNKNDDPAAYVRTENFTIYTSTSMPETATQTITEAFTAPEEEKRFSYSLNGTNVELRINDRIVKTLEYYYVPDEKYIRVGSVALVGTLSSLSEAVSIPLSN